MEGWSDSVAVDVTRERVSTNANSGQDARTTLRGDGTSTRQELRRQRRTARAKARQAWHGSATCVAHSRACADASGAGLRVVDVGAQDAWVERLHLRLNAAHSRVRERRADYLMYQILDLAADEYVKAPLWCMWALLSSVLARERVFAIFVDGIPELLSLASSPHATFGYIFLDCQRMVLGDRMVPLAMQPCVEVPGGLISLDIIAASVL